ncbi:uncharacterized protein PV06_01192 [Exophiala oligosperma]|uniref:DUF8212 domain-containing protein n=1 Tax=Exophiala oligosperma TaxID=215243 RepID=A0A0D2CFH0_9EURO|nr:uncharacterized protein PV06_01192 [Exophiala oligosperma]KIW48622.1 hypothetical protein PV06_01192 [Exophiala oligosperma]
MPLLYGEGDKAFIRLQEEIIRRSDDLSIFCNFQVLSHLEVITIAVGYMPQGWYLGPSQKPWSPSRIPSLRLLQFPDLERDHAENMVSVAVRELSGLTPNINQLFLRGVSLQARVENVQEGMNTGGRVILDCNHDSSLRSVLGLSR